jgi:hypothetical protein
VDVDIVELVSRFYNFLSAVVQRDLERSHWGEKHFNLVSKDLHVDLLPMVSDRLYDQTEFQLFWITGRVGTGKPRSRWLPRD